MSVYIEEMSSDSRFFTEAEANRLSRSIVQIKPDKSQNQGREKAVNFLEKLSLKPYPMSFEIVYDGEARKTVFQMVYPTDVSTDIRSEIHSKYPNAKIQDKNIPEPIFSRVEDDGYYVGAVDFELSEDYWYPINGIDLRDFDEDPLHEIIREMTKNGDSDVSVMFQVRYQALPDETVYTQRASLRAAIKGGLRMNRKSELDGLLTGVKRLFRYDINGRINELDYLTNNSQNPNLRQNQLDAIQSKYNPETQLYTVNISVVGIGNSEKDVERVMSSIGNRIQKETNDSATGQHLKSKPAKTKQELYNSVNNVVTRNLVLDKHKLRWFKSEQTKPCILAHTSLAEFVHISDGDIADKTIDISNIGDEGEMPPNLF